MSAVGTAAVPEGYVVPGTLAKVVAEVVIGRLDALVLTPAEHARAAAAIEGVAKATGIKGLDEQKLWAEWRRELLGCTAKDMEPLLASLDDPGSHYLAWLERRLEDPYHVSSVAFDKAVRRIGYKNGNLLVHVRWGQELAWARRLRSSSDDRDAVISQAFLVAAARDPGAEFLKLADAMIRAGDDLRYVLDPRHMYSSYEIDDGMGDGEFSPLFLRHGRMALAAKLDAMQSRDLAAAAAAVRKAQNAEVALRTRMRLAMAVRSVNLARNTGIIKVAIEVGFDSDSLAEAQEEFARDLERGEVGVGAATGLPLMEFYAWLRTRKPGRQSLGDPHAGIVASATLLSIVSRPERWLDTLPADYALMHPRDPATFHGWLQPLADGSRTFPQDPVLDYGFCLVSSNFRLSRHDQAADPPSDGAVAPRRRRASVRKGGA